MDGCSDGWMDGINKAEMDSRYLNDFLLEFSALVIKFQLSLQSYGAVESTHNLEFMSSKKNICIQWKKSSQLESQVLCALTSQIVSKRNHYFIYLLP